MLPHLLHAAKVRRLEAGMDPEEVRGREGGRRGVHGGPAGHGTDEKVAAVEREIEALELMEVGEGREHFG